MEHFNPRIAPADMENIHRAFNDLVDADKALKKAYRRIKIYRIARNALVVAGGYALYRHKKTTK